MKGTKRFAPSDSAAENFDTTSKRVMEGSQLNSYERESQTQSSSELSLDMNRALLSRHHVRALNSQFASWVQSQLKDHPDELWDDGVKDYLSHSRGIMEKFNDVVCWLKANAPNIGPLAADKQSNSGIFSCEKLPQSKSEYKLESNNINSSSTRNSGLFSGNESFGVSKNIEPSTLFPSTQNHAQIPINPSFGLLSSQSNRPLTNNHTSVSFSYNQSSGLSGTSQNTGAFSGTQAPIFFNSFSSGSFSNSQTSAILSNNHAPILFGQNPVKTDHNARDAEDDEELPQPSSPSVKKSQEEGIIVVHEVKCKLYVKSTDPASKDAWKERGTGQLLIKCREGIAKGTKESKPTIIIRNDVGKVLLNALLYPGIKTNAQKNSLVAIFHTADSDDGDNSNVIARTFLIRTKTAEERSKLETTINEFAPQS